MPARWNPSSLGTALFADLDQLLSPRQFTGWPGPDTLDALLPAGAGVRFVRQRDDEKLSGHDYERRIHERGEVPTRPENWHDLFNAMAWVLFPAAKRAINDMHVADGSFAGQRSARRDALTLFDECGVVLATTDETFRDVHRAHRWQEMFWRRRERWGRDIRAMIFGHGLYEQCLRPYVGLTAKACYLTVQADWFERPLRARYEIADRLLAESVRTRLTSTKELLPLPLLGVPGLWPANCNEDFYGNEAYFRPRRSA